MTLSLLNETLSELFQAFLDERAEDRTLLPNSVRTWEPHFRAFLDWLELGSKEPATLAVWHERTAQLYLAYLEVRPHGTEKGKNGLRPRTICSHFSSFRSFERWACAHGYLNSMPFASIKMPDLDEPIVKFIHPDEVVAILDACERLYPIRRRRLATAVMSVFFCTGLRYDDVRSLKIRNVFLSNRSNESKVTAEHSKGDKEFIAGLPDETVLVLRAWLAEREQLNCHESNDWLWAWSKDRRIGRLWWKEIREEIKAIGALDLEDRLVAHACRRAFATHLDDKGVPMSQIQKMLGHKHIETTMLYIDKSRKRLAKYVPAQGWREPTPQVLVAPPLYPTQTAPPVHLVVTAPPPPVNETPAPVPPTATAAGLSADELTTIIVAAVKALKSA